MTLLDLLILISIFQFKPFYNPDIIVGELLIDFDLSLLLSDHESSLPNARSVLVTNDVHPK